MPNLREFVFDFETGTLMPKGDFNKAETKKKRKAYYNKNKDYFKGKRQLKTDLEKFVKELKKDSTPSKRGRKKTLKQRHTITNDISGDITHTYTFPFETRLPILYYVCDDLLTFWEAVEENFNEAFNLKSIQDLLTLPQSKFVRMVITFRNIAFGNNEEKVRASPFMPSKHDAYVKLQNTLMEYFNKYGEDHILPLSINIQVRVRGETSGQGSASRTQEVANKVWRELSIKTRYNCLYASVCLAIHKDKYSEYYEDPDKLLNISKQLKSKLKGKFDKDPKRKFSTDEEIQMICDYRKQPIILYNNIYRKIREFKPATELKDKRSKPRDTIEIRINKGHYTTLLRRSDINEPYEIEETEAQCATTEGEVNHTPRLEIEGENVYELEWDKQQDSWVNAEDILIEKRTFPTKKAGDDVSTAKKQKIKKVKANEYHKCYGAYDIEATPNPNDHNFHKAYACGLAYYTQGGSIVHKQFWGMDCQRQFMDYLLKHIEDLDEYTIYAHNGGKYDYPNLFREALLTYEKLYMQDMIELNGRIISFKITDGSHTINFRDSACIFAGQSLDALTKEFDVEHKKLKEMVNHKMINLDNYMTHHKEITKYLEHDVKGLLEIVEKFSLAVFEATTINLNEVFTGATLSKKFYYKKFYNIYTCPIYYLTKMKDEFIRETYFGGRNEVFKLREVGDKAYYYDFTSLYPAVAQNYLPFGEPEWVQVDSQKKFDRFFGFCDVWVKSKDFSKKPIHAHLMPVKSSKRLVFAHYKDWTKMRLFSQEIRLGMKSGVYEYKFDDECLGIKFSSKPFLKDFFKQCFEKKATAKKEGHDALSQTYKIIANSGYGFWGLRWADRESILVGRKGDIDPYEYLEKGKLYNECEWGENSLYTGIRVEKDLEMKDFNVAIASAITSYARMRLWGLIDMIESKGCKVFYCDTDSVITNCDITKYADIMKEYCWDKTGDELGSLKNELLDKIVKYNKKATNKIDIAKQKEHDGGDLYFDECFICGCKFYAVSKTLYDGEKIFMTKLKGFKNYEDSKLEYEWYRKLVSGEMTSIEQDQEQWNLPKSCMVDEQRAFGLNITPIHKVFKINYSKGIENAETGEIRPLIL
jgi:hypothetical protein